MYLYSLTAKNLLHVEEILVDDATCKRCLSSLSSRKTLSAKSLRARDWTKMMSDTAWMKSSDAIQPLHAAWMRVAQYSRLSCLRLTVFVVANLRRTRDWTKIMSETSRMKLSDAMNPLQTAWIRVAQATCLSCLSIFFRVIAILRRTTDWQRIKSESTKIMRWEVSHRSINEFDENERHTSDKNNVPSPNYKSSPIRSNLCGR